MTVSPIVELLWSPWALRRSEVADRSVTGAVQLNSRPVMLTQYSKLTHPLFTAAASRSDPPRSQLMAGAKAGLPSRRSLSPDQLAAPWSPQAFL